MIIDPREYKLFRRGWTGGIQGWLNFYPTKKGGSQFCLLEPTEYYWFVRSALIFFYPNWPRVDQEIECIDLRELLRPHPLLKNKCSLAWYRSDIVHFIKIVVFSVKIYICNTESPFRMFRFSDNQNFEFIWKRLPMSWFFMIWKKIRLFELKSSLHFLVIFMCLNYALFMHRPIIFLVSSFKFFLYLLLPPQSLKGVEKINAIKLHFFTNSQKVLTNCNRFAIKSELVLSNLLLSIWR